MRQLHSDLWIADSELRFLGLEVGARMTVVRLPDSRLWVHSPIAATEDLALDVAAVGRVAYLVAPNRLHHLFVDSWQRAFPDAATWVAPGLETKRADLAAVGALADDPEPDWSEQLDQVVVDGFPFASEVVFFHRPSATLIVTDLAFNLGASSPPLTRLESFVHLAAAPPRASADADASDAGCRNRRDADRAQCRRTAQQHSARNVRFCPRRCRAGDADGARRRRRLTAAATHPTTLSFPPRQWVA